MGCRHPVTLQSLILHESSAEHSVSYEPQVIHGLLQTPEYARALITAVKPDIDEDRVAGAVRTRMERRRILSLPNPARFTFYVHEHALRLRIGSDHLGGGGLAEEQSQRWVRNELCRGGVEPATPTYQ